MKKHLLNYLIGFMAMVTLFVACDKNGLDISEDMVVNNEDEYVIEAFARALAISLAESKELRELIKDEALRKINHDYDVLYLLINNVKLNNHLTVDELLLKHMEAEDLNKMIHYFPTLTIFVPSLPENSFSCETWNIETQIPDIAVRPLRGLRTYCYEASGHEYHLDSDEIPGYPILVLKINERMVVNENNTNLKLRSVSNPKVAFEFIDPVFDNTTSNIETRRSDYKNDTKLKKALESFNVFPNNLIGWQRDYIYYNLTSEQDRGRIDVRFRESIVGFKFAGNPNTLIDQITRFRDDPKLINKNDWFEMREIRIPNTNTSILTPWTDGEFEFTVNFNVLSKNTPGSETTTNFRLDPTRLFQIDLTSKKKGALWWRKTVYKITNIQSLYCPIEVPMFDYDLSKYSTSYKISILEKDDPQTVKQSVQTATEFASNFSFDPSVGELMKTGTKYGKSEKETKTVIHETTITTGSDDLGTVIVNFEDEVIRSNESKFENILGRSSYPIPDFNQAYKTGFYQIHICPLLLN